MPPAQSANLVANNGNTISRVTLYTAGHLHTAVPHCSHSRAPIVHTAVLRENNEHGCVYLHCRAVCKLPGCVEGHPCICGVSVITVFFFPGVQVHYRGRRLSHFRLPSVPNSSTMTTGQGKDKWQELSTATEIMPSNPYNFAGPTTVDKIAV